MTQRGLARFTTPGTRRIVDRAGTADSDAADAPANGDAAGVQPTDTLAEPLARLLDARRPPSPGEACELCAAPIPDDHRHVVDLERRALLCSCRGCALLFEFSDAGAHRYHTVPDRYLRIEPFALPPQAWAALQIPVGIAFVVANSKLDATVAFYPSPGGATESELPLDAWDEIVAANPGLEQVQPDVEAVLVRTDDGPPTCHVVPVDRCYELVGALRLHWRGFDGGSEVREHIAAFFDDVARRSRRVSVVRPGSGPLTRPPSKVLRSGGQPPLTDGPSAGTTSKNAATTSRTRGREAG